MVNEIFEKDYTYEEIFENLKSEETEDFIKIFSIINIKDIAKSDDFKTLIFHLTEHSTPVREITALKLEDLSKKQSELFLNDYSKEQILKGIKDINPNVSRAVCSIIEENIKLQLIIFDDLIIKINELIAQIKQSTDKKEQINKKSHAKNKKNFALYWYLETLSVFKEIKNNSEVLGIVNFALDFYDYTIREKGAKILVKIKEPPIELLQKAKSDQNFYVKNLVYDKINDRQINRNIL